MDGRGTVTRRKHFHMAWDRFSPKALPNDVVDTVGGGSTPVELFLRSCAEIDGFDFGRLLDALSQELIGTSWPEPTVTTMRGDK